MKYLYRFATAVLLVIVDTYIARTQANCSCKSDWGTVESIADEKRDDEKSCMISLLAVDEKDVAASQAVQILLEIKPTNPIDSLISNIEKYGPTIIPESGVITYVSKAKQLFTGKNFTAVKYSIVCMMVNERLKNLNRIEINNKKKSADSITISKTTYNSLGPISEFKSDIFLFQILFLVSSIIGITFVILFIIKYRKRSSIENTPFEKTQITKNEYRDFLIRFAEQIYQDFVPRSEYNKLSEDRRSSNVDNIAYESGQKREHAIHIIHPNNDNDKRVSTSDGVRGTGTVSKTLFASLPSGKLFYKTVNVLSPLDTYFILNINSENEGTFTIVDDLSTKEHAFSMIDNLRDACNIKGSGKPILGNVKITPGVVEKEGEFWKITKPVTLEW